MGVLCSRQWHGEAHKGGKNNHIDNENENENEIDNRIRQQTKAETHIHKLLLLGTGESGKSTIFKQIQLLFHSGFDDALLRSYTSVVHANVFQSIKLLVDASKDFALRHPPDPDSDSTPYSLSQHNQDAADALSEIGGSSEYPPLTPQLSQDIQRLWNDPAIQETYSRGSEIQLPDCTHYFMQHLTRLSDVSYVPTKEDVLFARVRTTGVVEIQFSPVGENKKSGEVYRLFDVGGQRNERRKWIHLFEGVTAVIFCAAISEYDQMLYECENKNRMMETKELFEWVLKQPCFERASIMLFLNKFDLFEQKVHKVPLNVCDWFKDYQQVSSGKQEIEHAYEFVKKKFEELYYQYTAPDRVDRVFKIYRTTALDPKLVKKTFKLLDETLRRRNLVEAGSMLHCVLSSVTCYSRYPDLKTWNKAIKRQIQEGNVTHGLSSFFSMREQGFYPDNFTFPVLFEAASRPSLICLGYALHGQAIKTGYCRDLYVQTSLLNMYSRFKHVDSAYKVFVQTSVKDIIMWNSMLDAFTSNGLLEEATELFESSPVKDVTSFNIMISGYAKSGQLELARGMFDAAPARDVVSWNSIIMAYTLAGRMEEARRLFDKVPMKNVVTWNTMVTGFLQNELYVEAIEVFEQMRAKNFKSDHVTISSVLAACAHLGSAESGRALHIYALDNNLVCPEVTTSLIDMYAKCGCIYDSMQVFYKSEVKDLFSWNAVISGLAFNGHADAALKIFDEIKCRESLRPDDITFIAVLSACAHSGLVQEGCSIFTSLNKHGISPKVEHYGCMVDLLGKANLLSQAFQLVESMPFNPGEKVLGALLSACVTHQDRYVGRKVVAVLMDRAEKMSDGEFMMVSNLHATCGEWEEAARWRQKMSDEGILKNAGCSLIELHGTTRRFVAGVPSYKCPTIVYD